MRYKNKSKLISNIIYLRYYQINIFKKKLSVEITETFSVLRDLSSLKFSRVGASPCAINFTPDPVILSSQVGRQAPTLLKLISIYI